MEETENQESSTSNRRKKIENQQVLKAKWRTSLDAGWTVVPSALLRGLPRLHIDANGLAVLICLIDYWWAPQDLPWPSKKALSERLGVSERTIQRTLAHLKEEGLVKAEARHGAHGGQTSNKYDLSPLVTKLEGIVRDIKTAEAEAAKIKRAATRPGYRPKGQRSGPA
jgi:hypothetical protein